jgi:hypothetical protein
MSSSPTISPPGGQALIECVGFVQFVDDAAGLAMHETLLAEATARVGEVEAAEWALDQAKAACKTEIAATLATGVPAERSWRRQGNWPRARPNSPKTANPRRRRLIPSQADCSCGS